MVSSQETGIYEGNLQNFRRYIASYTNGLVAVFKAKMEVKAWLETMLPSISVYKETILPKAVRSKKFYIIDDGRETGIFRSNWEDLYGGLFGNSNV